MAMSFLLSVASKKIKRYGRWSARVQVMDTCASREICENGISVDDAIARKNFHLFHIRHESSPVRQSLRSRFVRRRAGIVLS